MSSSPTDPSSSRFTKIVAVFSGIAVISGVVFTFSDRIISIFRPPNPPQCGLSKFESQAKYQKAEDKFFENYESTQLSDSISLWNESGSPRLAEEVLISQSQKLTDLKNAILNEQLAYSPNKLIFIYGSAGSGKSAVVKSLEVGDSVAFIDLAKLRYNVEEDQVHPMTLKKPQLKIGSTIISYMADLQPQEKEKDLIQLLNTIVNKNKENPENIDNKKTIIIDALDELHPHSSTHILSIAKDYLDKNPSKNIIFAGRGESFLGYMSKYRYQAIHEAIPVGSIYLNSPELREWYASNYLVYLYRKKNPKDNQDYIPDMNEVEKLRDELNDLVAKNSELRHYMKSLEPINALIRNKDNRTNYNYNELAQDLYSSMMRRNRETHGRPTEGESPLYDQALVQAARQVELEQRPDGSFTALVRFSETIKLNYEDKCIEVNIASLLGRSGIASLNPFYREQTEYIFQPMIMQKIIAEENF